MKIKHLITATLLSSTVICTSLINSVSAERKQNKNNNIDLAARRDLVSAWQKHDPAVTPFIGSWLDYETIWSIYPSATKGQVCVVQREMDMAVLHLGNVKNGKVQMETGWVISSQGDKLNVAFPNSGASLKIFGQLEEPSKLQYVKNSYLVPLLRIYKQAGCTAALPKNNNASQTNIENLADGYYLYGEVPHPDGFGKEYVVFRKSGKTIAGHFYITNTDKTSCFQGIAKGDHVVNATSIITVINPPNYYDHVSSNMHLKMGGYYPIKSSEESKRKSVEYCLQKINKTISAN